MQQELPWQLIFIPNLKEPSHDIRMAWKWYGGIGLVLYMNRQMFNNFLTVPLISYQRFFPVYAEIFLMNNVFEDRLVSVPPGLQSKILMNYFYLDCGNSVFLVF